MSDIFIDLDRTGAWFVFYTPYNPVFISELKARIPPPNRRWVSEERAWCVSRTYWDTAQELLRKHYPNGQFQLGEMAQAADILVEPDAGDVVVSAQDYAVLGLRPDAPDCVVHAAYLALAASWQSVDAPTLIHAGFHSLDNTNSAYLRICASRHIPREPPPDMAALLTLRAERQ